jgi:hypothetical protein
MALFPTPFVLLYLPGIDDISYEIQRVTCVVFEEVVELVRLTVFGSEMYITNKDRAVCLHIPYLPPNRLQ